MTFRKIFTPGNISFFVLSLLVLALSSCKPNAAGRIRMKKLKVDYSTNTLKRGDSLTVTLDEDAAIDSLGFENARPLSISNDKHRLVFSFDHTGSADIDITAFTADGKRHASRKIEVVSSVQPVQRQYEVVQVLPHDPDIYTQGLEFHNGLLYQSKGLYHQSAILKKTFPQLKTKVNVPLDGKYFGEGLTVVNDTVYQLTWRENTCFLYDTNLTRIGQLSLPTSEGWGLCHDGPEIYLSDGSANLYQVNHKLGIVQSREIYAGSKALKNLNELEFVKGQVAANDYETNLIYFIDFKTGEATGFVDFAALRKQLQNPDAEVLNGIAYLPQRDLYLITGKLWDKAFLVRIK